MEKMEHRTAREIAEKVRRGDASAEEVVSYYLDRIEKVDDGVKAYISLFREEALIRAREIDGKREKGVKLGKLAGVPIAIKDNICTEGNYTTAASKVLEKFLPPYDATVIEKIKKADGILLGKTNLDEFAMGSSCENSAFFPTRNPYDLERAPGGSSGGSAAAVAAGMAPLALGSDTGGSIRQPAALSGIVGLKPTYGRVSRYGLLAFASSLDQIGPMARNVGDTALLLEVLAGEDKRDSTCLDKQVPAYSQKLSNDIEGMKIGIPQEYFEEGLDEEIAAATQEGIQHLENLGAKTVSISLPHTKYAISTYYIVCTAEASSNLARYDGVQYGLRALQKELVFQNNELELEESDNVAQMTTHTRSRGFGAEVRRRIMLGTYVLSAGYYDAYYLRGLKVRTLIRQDFQQAFEKVDAIVCPTSPVTAFKLGEKVNDPLQMYLVDIYTVSISLSGLPALSVPCGYDSKGLPIGLQMVGKPFAEQNLLNLAYAYEENTWDNRRPPQL